MSALSFVCLFCVVYVCMQVYAEVTVSAYQLSGEVAVYVVLDQAELSLSCDLTVDTISWSDVSSPKLLYITCRSRKVGSIVLYSLLLQFTCGCVIITLLTEKS